MAGQIKHTLGAFGTNKSSYTIENDRFINTIAFKKHEGNPIDHSEFIEFSQDIYDKIIEYSLRDNSLVELMAIERTEDHIRIVSRYYPDYIPLTIIGENCIYDQDTFDIRSGKHDLYMRDVYRMVTLYNRIVDEYQQFIEETGLYISDMNANNILMNDSFTKFKIVDIASIKTHTKRIEVDPVGVLLTGKFRWSHYPQSLRVFDPVIFKFIPNHAQLIHIIDKEIAPRLI